MSLNKFSEFQKNKKQHQKNVVFSNKKEKKIVESSTIKDSKVEDSKIENSKNFYKKNLVIEFFNKKPSESYKFLVENNFSTKDVKYSVSEQNKNSISIFKYDLKSELNIYDFCESLINYYKKSGLNKILENVKINGDDKVALIQNLPDKKFIKILKENLFKLLK
jgi:hypothetical protein